MSTSQSFFIKMLCGNIKIVSSGSFHISVYSGEMHLEDTTVAIAAPREDIQINLRTHPREAFLKWNAHKIKICALNNLPQRWKRQTALSKVSQAQMYCNYLQCASSWQNQRQRASPHNFPSIPLPYISESFMSASLTANVADGIARNHGVIFALNQKRNCNER